MDLLGVVDTLSTVGTALSSASMRNRTRSRAPVSSSRVGQALSIGTRQDGLTHGSQGHDVSVRQLLHFLLFEGGAVHSPAAYAPLRAV
jgi:hypothetical protein